MCPLHKMRQVYKTKEIVMDLEWSEFQELGKGLCPEYNT